MSTRSLGDVCRIALPDFGIFSLILFLSLFGFTSTAQAQQDPGELPESTRRTSGGGYEELQLTVSINDLASVNLIVNGGFETGNFSGWTVSPFGNQGWYQWQVTPAGGGTTHTSVSLSSPFAGVYSAWNGFCCNTNPNPEYIYQDVTIPASQNAVLKWSSRIQSNLTDFCSPVQCGSNIFRVEVLNPANSAVLQTLHTFTAVGGANYNTGWVTHTANLSAFAGQTVRIRFSTNYTSLISGHLNGPGRAELDEISLTASPSYVYMRSTVGSPWGSSTNEAAMNTVFGAGNWHDLRYETAIAADVFSPNIALVFMEGGDSNANEMEAFLNANQALIESWVASGGRLLLNAAPNEGNGMSYGFGGAVLNFTGGSYVTAANVASIAAGQSAHPIFNNPYTPVGSSFSGGFFSHASVSCGTCTPLITGTAYTVGGTITILSEKTFGSGRVMFGGMTTTNFHSPQPHATNLRRNILYYLLNSVVNSNTAPSALADAYSTNEDTPLNVPADGVLDNDSDNENDALTATLVAGPANAQSFTLNPDGSFSYTPNANYHGGDSFTYKANDGQADSNVVTVTITVNSVNDPPTLAGVPANQIIPEEAAYGFNATASDEENSPLVFSLDGAPAGASIDPDSGVFSWTPTEAQGPGVYSFTVRVADPDGGVDDLPISLDVQEVNVAPTLDGVPSAATIDELSPYGFTATSADADVPTQTLTFSLVGAPAGASIDPNTGLFAWTPAEDQGPAVHSFAVRVSDGVTNTDAPISLTVAEVNGAPVLNAIADQTIDEEVLFNLGASAIDPDNPANALTYSLDTAPAGMTIDPLTGSISWTPAETDGPGDHPVTVRVVDDGTPSLSHTISFSVHVNEVNIEPVIDAIGNKMVDENTLLTFDANASDVDLPANGLTFSLVSAPAGASIDPSTGVFSWVPSEAQGGNPNSQYVFTVRVTDDGSPAMSDEEQITVTVNEVNSPPVLDTINNQTGIWGNAFSFDADASDPDIPANGLTFSLISAPAGASINPSTGAFSWTPTMLQIGSHTFTVRVTDDGSPTMSDEQPVTINVGRRPTALVYTGDGSEQYSDQQGLTATLTDAGGGALNGNAIAGRTVGFAIGTQNASDTTDASGICSTDLILTQNPNLVYTVDSTFAGDAYYLPASDSDAFDIVQEDARTFYTGTLFASTSCATCGTGNVTLAATVKDITAADPPDPAIDSFEGDIRNAKVTFVNRDAGNAPIAGCANLPVGLVDMSDTKVGTANCNWNVDLGSQNSLDFRVGVVVSHYYSRNASAEDTVITISKPIGTNFITGGGYLILTESSGQYPGVDGLKSNFGFNVKYNSSGKNLQGRVNVLVRGADGKVYQIKGNVMRTLSVNSSNPNARKAVWSGKATLSDVTNPLAPIDLGGNNTFQMEMTDRGEPGSTDSLSITLWNDAGGLLHSSNWNGTRSIEQTIAGGNLVVR
jgi:VCBS repeat-containing protein